MPLPTSLAAFLVVNHPISQQWMLLAKLVVSLMDVWLGTILRHGLAQVWSCAAVLLPSMAFLLRDMSVMVLRERDDELLPPGAEMRTLMPW